MYAYTACSQNAELLMKARRRHVCCLSGFSVNRRAICHDGTDLLVGTIGKEGPAVCAPGGAREARGVLGDAFALATSVSCSARARWNLGQGHVEGERPSRARCCHAAVLDVCFLGAACRYQGAPGALPRPLNELDLGRGSASTSSNNAFVALSRLVRELLFALTSILHDAARSQHLATPCVP